jgi:TolB protein
MMHVPPGPVFRIGPRHLGVLLLAIILTAPAGVSAQDADDPEYQGTIIGTGPRQIPIGIPAVRDLAGLSDPVGTGFRRTLVDDLAYSGFFRPLGADGPVVDPERLQLGAWRLAGAQQVLVTTLQPMAGDTGDLILEGRLYEVLTTGEGVSARMLLGRRYAGPTGSVSRLAHRLADEVVEKVTGQRGIARTRLAYVVQEGRAKEVYIADYDGRQARRITRTGTINLSPVWSPDGSRLAFLSYRAGNPTVFLLSEDGQVTQIRLGGGDLNAAPDWSPDGRLLAFSSNRSGNSEIYLHDLETGEQSRLTQHPAIDTAPAWAPSGRELAFTSDRSGSPQIYLMDRLGANVRRVSYEGTYCDSAAWSPRGGELAYVARIAGVFQLVVYDLETGQTRVITTGYGHKENPRWSPDGRHLVFASNRVTGEYALHTIHADGTGLRRLESGIPAFTPDWSP